MTNQLDVLVADKSDQLLFTLTLGNCLITKQRKNLTLNFKDLFSWLTSQKLG